MKLQVKLEINNFGPINKAEIELNKINIIAGPNTSGKTTSSKFLYSFLSLASSDGMKLYNDSVKNRIYIMVFDLLQKMTGNFEEKEKIRYYLNRLDKSNDIFSTEKLFKEINEFIFNSSFQKDKEIIGKINKFNEVAPFEFEKEERLYKILIQILSLEFNNFIMHLKNKNSRVKFKGKDKKEFCMILDKEQEKKLILPNDLLECFKEREIIYMETPYILDFSSVSRGISTSYHQSSLLDKLKDESYKKDLFDKEFNTALDNVIEKINPLMDGNSIYYNTELERFELEQKENEPLTMNNTASGLKQMGIICLLLKNRKLFKDSILIMDEPEVHLHPEWQVKLAEIIVILAKDLNITSYVNSHSPQFIEAIETYSLAYEIEDYVNYYLSEPSPNKKNTFNINPVDLSDLIEIYDNLGQPYRDLAKIKGKWLAKKSKQGSDSYKLPN